jgi:uncharacterized membrane protein
VVALFIFLLVLTVVSTGVGISLYRRQVRKADNGKQGSRLPFRWKYILLPVIFFAISVILAMYFIGKLPFQIAYHFDFNGAPDGRIIREYAIAIGLAIQLVLLLISFFIVMGMRRNRFFSPQSPANVKPDTLVTLMGNLPAFLQLVILFEMGDVFSYNAFYKHIFPQWLFLIIVLVLATAAFLAFVRVIGLKAIRQSKS